MERKPLWFNVESPAVDSQLWLNDTILMILRSTIIKFIVLVQQIVNMINLFNLFSCLP